MLAAWKEAGVEPPAEFLQPVHHEPAPELTLVDMQYLTLYNEAATCRPMGSMGGLAPIPFTAIDAVARRFAFRNDEFLTALWIVRALDAEVLNNAKEELDKEQANANLH